MSKKKRRQLKCSMCQKKVTADECPKDYNPRVCKNCAKDIYNYGSD